MNTYWHIPQSLYTSLVFCRIYDSLCFPRGLTQSPPNKAQQCHFTAWEAFKVILASAFLVQSIVSLARVPRLQAWHRMLHNVSINFMFCLQESPWRSRLSCGITLRCRVSSRQREGPTYWQACLHSNRSRRMTLWSLYFYPIQIFKKFMVVLQLLVCGWILAGGEPGNM